MLLTFQQKGHQVHDNYLVDKNTQTNHQKKNIYLILVCINYLITSSHFKNLISLIIYTQKPRHIDDIYSKRIICIIGENEDERN